MTVDVNDILVDPCVVINLLEHTVNDVGINTVIKERFYEKTREAWVGAVLLLAIKKIEGSRWWLKVNKTDAPDVLAYKFIEEESGKIRRYEKTIEIFNWVKYSSNTLIQEIDKKLNKKYPKYFTLVGYVMKKGKVELNEIHNKLVERNPQMQEILLIGTANNNGREVVVNQVWPKLFSITVHLDADCQGDSEPKFLIPFRGKKKSKMYKKLGKTAILKPDFSIEKF